MLLEDAGVITLLSQEDTPASLCPVPLDWTPRTFPLADCDLSLFHLGGGRFSQVLLGEKNHPANAGDLRDAGLIPGLGRSPGGGQGSPLLENSCLKNPPSP